MPLPEPVPRTHRHTRAIDYRGYEREDGLWDIEAHMTDTKTYTFRNDWRGEIVPGVPLHEMLLRVTIDDTFLIKDIIAATDHSPFEICPDITGNYKAVIGLRMGPGWRKAVRAKVGGTQGCTHLTELLFPLATVAMQTLWPILRARREQAGKPAANPPRRPAVLDSCHAWASDSPVTKVHAPAFYTGGTDGK